LNHGESDGVDGGGLPMDRAPSSFETGLWPSSG
jgi:hypothetical protein